MICHGETPMPEINLGAARAFGLNKTARTLEINIEEHEYLK